MQWASLFPVPFGAPHARGAAKQNPENLLVFAVGNFGGLKDTDFKRCTLSSPAMAKNVLSVGASSSGPSRGGTTGADGRLMYEEYDVPMKTKNGDPTICSEPDLGLPSSSTEQADIDTVAWFSAYGPTRDNRIKPEVVAPGDVVGAHTCSMVLVAMEFV